MYLEYGCYTVVCCDVGQLSARKVLLRALAVRPAGSPETRTNCGKYCSCNATLCDRGKACKNFHLFILSCRSNLIAYVWTTLTSPTFYTIKAPSKAVSQGVSEAAARALPPDFGL